MENPLEVLCLIEMKAVPMSTKNDKNDPNTQMISRIIQINSPWLKIEGLGQACIELRKKLQLLHSILFFIWDIRG